jgi:hypothetical protein
VCTFALEIKIDHTTPITPINSEHEQNGEKREQRAESREQKGENNVQRTENTQYLRPWNRGK